MNGKQPFRVLKPKVVVFKSHPALRPDRNQKTRMPYRNPIAKHKEMIIWELLLLPVESSSNKGTALMKTKAHARNE